MAKTEHYYVKFQPDCFYHVYNRAVDKKSLFKKENDHVFFLKRYSQYLSPVLTTYSYALCGNHFHFGVKIKSLQELKAFRQSKKHCDRFENAHDLVSEQFRLFFLSYAKVFNTQYNRVGTLFQTPFKRCLVGTEEKLIRLIFYHHANPQRHKLCRDFRKYPWTSYQRYLSDRQSLLPKAEVFALLGGRQQFIKYHQEVNRELNDKDDWYIEY